MAMRKLALVVHNVRSTHNVGSLLRTADGLGITKVFLCGYTPYPEVKNDDRLPHIRQKVGRAIHKTALGAELSVDWEYVPDIGTCLVGLSRSGYKIAALEQTNQSINLASFKPGGKMALVVGNEVDGIDKKTLKLMDCHLAIPMLGHKESFNVAVAAAIALYHLRYA